MGAHRTTWASRVRWILESHCRQDLFLSPPPPDRAPAPDAMVGGMIARRHEGTEARRHGGTKARRALEHAACRSRGPAEAASSVIGRLTIPFVPPCLRACPIVSTHAGTGSSGHPAGHRRGDRPRRGVAAGRVVAADPVDPSAAGGRLRRGPVGTARSRQPVRSGAAPLRLDLGRADPLRGRSEPALRRAARRRRGRRQAGERRGADHLGGGGRREPPDPRPLGAGVSAAGRDPRRDRSDGGRPACSSTSGPRGRSVVSSSGRASSSIRSAPCSPSSCSRPS